MTLRRIALSFLVLLVASQAESPRVTADGEGALEQLDGATKLDSLPALPETTTPMPFPKSPPAILESIAHAIYLELTNSPYQCANAFLAFIFGLVLVYDGEFSFRWLLVCATFLVVAILAMNQITATWGASGSLRQVVGLEAGIVGGYAALRGIDGVQVVVGAILGAALAHQTLVFLAAHGFHSLVANRWCLVAYFSAFVIGFVIMFSKKLHLKSLAVLSAGLGGAFCSSAIAFACTELAVKGYMPFLQRLPTVNPVGGTWIQFMHFLCSSSAADVGIFAGSEYNLQHQDETWRTDKLADCTLWLIFCLVGIKVQLRRLKQNKAQVGDDKALSQSLLGDLPKQKV
eukprot:CAMPEP_0197651148 /NCGR_PEP_ID=MMETSP1338-20131121/31378_1 /TAXON_ID=43686 ORGANISM="Pelagodinium beii, Strain RCC1491" /NCGR_SAMPLE_ID=MMETSP1338 /ASSEMBLY_ACC=CAM_ASM_000754 /LENGTH=344 /DNA_ID=CAMNT_0043225713 /DNA_START=35 /DNA_END=1069 /DNA_ORIENTATION=+